jgi:hypothetical protein
MEPVGADCGDVVGGDVVGAELANAEVGEGVVDGWTTADPHATSTSVARSEGARARRDILNSVSGGGQRSYGSRQAARTERTVGP